MNILTNVSDIKDFVTSLCKPYGYEFSYGTDYSQASFYVFEKTSVGLLSKLALNITSRQFVAEPIKDDSYP